MYLLSSANGERGTRAFIPRAIGRYATCHGFPWSCIAECGAQRRFRNVSHRSEILFGADQSNCLVSNVHNIKFRIVSFHLLPSFNSFHYCTRSHEIAETRRFNSKRRRDRAIALRTVARLDTLFRYARREATSKDGVAVVARHTRRTSAERVTSSRGISGNRRESNCDAARAAYRTRHALGGPGSDRARSTESPPLPPPPPPPLAPSRPAEWHARGPRPRSRARL